MTGMPAVAGWASSSANAAAPMRPCADRLVAVAGGAALVLGVVGVDQHAAGPGRPWRPARPASPSCRPGWPGRARPPRRGRCRSRRPATGGPRRPPGRGRGPAPSTARLRPPPALGSTSSLGRPRGGGVVEQRQQRLAQLVQRLGRRARRRPRCPRGRPPRSRRSPRPARSAWASVATERSTVSSVGEPRFTSSDAWMYAGSAALADAVAEQRVLLRVARRQRPAARVGDVHLQRLRAGGVDVRQGRLGQPARRLGVRPDPAV